MTCWKTKAGDPPSKAPEAAICSATAGGTESIVAQQSWLSMIRPFHHPRQVERFGLQLTGNWDGRARDDAETILGNLVAGCIQTQDHPAIEERDAAVGDLSLVLEDIVRKRIGGELAASFDGLQTLTVQTDGERILHIAGAFYVLETTGAGGTGHRMLPVQAELTLEPAATSIVKVGGRSSLFEMPQSARQLVRGIEGADWRHRLELRLR